MSDQKSPALAGTQAQKIVTELKVSGNLMTLDAGLFCIFNAPGSALPDPATGLPGVRISLPPGPAFRPEAITITSFREDGWLGGWNGAALVRVVRGPAQVLVTIYQAPNSRAEAPRLQILRLAESAALPPVGQAAAPAATALPGPQPVPQIRPAANAPDAPAPPRPRAVAPGPSPVTPPQNTPAAAGRTSPEAAGSAEVVAHIQTRGDVLARLGEWMGEPGSKRWIEGFAVSPKGPVGPNDVEYQAVLGRGWLSPWAEGGQFCGSRGMSLPILGLRLRLRGEAAEKYDCIVTASFVDGTKIGPMDNGEPCQAESMSPLEAFNIRLTPRGQPEAAASTAPSKPATRTAAPKAASAARKTEAAAPAPAPAPAPSKSTAKAAGKPPPAKPPKAPSSRK